MNKCMWCFTMMFFASGMSHAGGFTFIYSEESDEVKDFLKGFSKNDSGKTFEIKQNNIESIQACSREDVYIVFGAYNASKLLKKCPKIKLIISDSERNVINFEANQGKQYPAIFVDQSIKQQALSIQRHIPHLKEIGILYQTEHERKLISKADQSSSVSFLEQKVEDHESPGPYFRDLIKNVDGILITTNNNIWQKKDIRGFLLYSLRQGKVMLGGPTKDYVKAGVFAGVYTNMEDLGEKASLAIISGNHDQMRMYPDDGVFIFNRFLASRLSIQVIDE